MDANTALLERFAVEHFERNGISAGRRAQTLVTLREVASQLGGRSLADMTPSDLMAWQGAQRVRGLVPNTIRNRESMVRAFLSWGYVAGVIDFERATQLKAVTSVRGAAGPEPRPYKRVEVEQFRESLAALYPLAPAQGRGSRSVKLFLAGQMLLRGAVKRHARRLQYEAQVSLALEEGLRCIEIYRIGLANIEPSGEAVVVRTAKSDTERWREVPWTNHSRLVVQEWLDFRALVSPPHDRPWLTLRTDDPRGPQTWDHFRRSLERFEGVYTWHRFRHTFATERLRAGLPLEKLQIMLGHANLQQTLAYAKIVHADVKAEADRTESAFAEALGLAA